MKPGPAHARLLAAAEELVAAIREAFPVDNGAEVVPIARARKARPRKAKPAPITDPYERALACERIANFVASRRSSR